MSGMDNIIKRIIEQANIEAEKIIKEAEDYRNKKLAEAEEQGKKLLQKTIEELEEQEKSEINKIKSAALLKSKHKILETKEKVVSEAFKIAKEKISKIISSDEYKKILAKFIEDSAIALNGGKLIIQLPKQHQNIDIDLKSIEQKVKKETGNNTKLEIDKEPIRSLGGVIVRNKDNTKWVDNTIEARFERFDKKIRTEITSILFE